MSQASDKTLPMSQPSVEEELVVLYNPDELQHVFKYQVLKAFNIGDTFESQYQILEGYVNIFVYDNYMDIEGKEKVRLYLDEGSEQAIDILDSIEDAGHIKKI